MEKEVTVAWIGVLGTIGAALIAGAVALYTAGRKANESSDRPESISANLQAGLTLINPSRPASDSFQSTPRATGQAIPTSSPVQEQTRQSLPVTSSIKDGTCSGLDRKVWSVEIAPISILRGKDAGGQDSTGYNVNLRLADNSDRAFYINYNQAELTDDGGNQLKLSSTSLQPNNPNFPATEVSAGADLPVNLKFMGNGQAGKSVSFSINLHIFTQDDKPRIDKVETLACTSLQVS